MEMKVDRIIRALTLATAVATCLATAPACAQEMKGKVVVAVTGGLLGKKLKTAVDEYVRAFPVEVVYVEGNSSDLLAKVRAQKGNPQIDLFFGNDQTFAMAKSLSLLAKIDPKLVPNITRIPAALRDPDGYGQYFEANPVGYCYRTDKFAENKLQPLTSWLDYKKPEVKGRAIVFPPTQLFGLHHLVGIGMSMGGSEKDLSQIWSNVEQIIANGAVVLQSTAQAETMTGRGEAWVYPCSSDRAFLAKASGTSTGFSVPKDGSIFFADFMGPVQGSPNPVAAQMILNHMLSVPVQTRLSTEGAIMPANSDVKLTADQKRRLGFDPDKPLPEPRFLDAAALTKQLDGLVERFNRTVTR